ncbi:MAG: SpoIIE family protein phosphatase [Bacteroidales bacterium]|nr:SpoIIE family protein phosphatase [Bacteroidales bacterium]MBR4215009.1 SpoIIE family protein phosphatase [Bacteroidales bacterium]
MPRFLFILLAMFVAQLSVAQEPNRADYSDIEDSRAEYLRAVESGNQHDIVTSRINLALVYWYSKSYNEALTHLKGAAATACSIGDIKSEINVNDYLSIIYSELQQYDEALHFALEGVKLARAASLYKETVTSLINSAAVLMSQKNYNRALEYIMEALDVAYSIKNNLLICRCCQIASQIYAEMGDTEKSNEYARLYRDSESGINEQELFKAKKSTQDELLRAESEVIAKDHKLHVLEVEQQKTLDSLYRVEMLNNQMRLEMQLLGRDREIAELKIRQKENEIAAAERFKTAAVIVLSVFLVLLVLMGKFLRDRNRANRRLENTNAELSDTYETVKLQNRLLNTKTKQIEEQRNELERKNNQIIDSISSASRIQKAMLPKRRMINSHFEESFVFFEPRDVVSGDFYWFSDTGRYRYLAVIDCVGHSVQGAFMSVVANSLLNDIVNKKKVESPAEILRLMNVEIIKAWSHDSEHDTSDQGMDVSLCRFDNESNEITVAAANHTVLTICNGECNEIQGDIYSIGASFADSIDSVFTNHVIQNQPGMSLYMFSDGFQDQLGGDKGRKYMQDNLKKLIISIQDTPLSRQPDLLGEALEAWKNGRQQTDDILVIGVKNRLIEN